jgi:hypothetical protein
MAPKRKSAGDEGNAPKKAKAATTPKLKKSKTPDWTSETKWSQDKPTGEWAEKVVDKWGCVICFNLLTL